MASQQGVHRCQVELDSIAPRQAGKSNQVQAVMVRCERGQLLEEVFESSRRYHFKKPDRFAARVPEGVEDSLGLVNAASGTGLLDFGSLLDGEGAFQHVGNLVLPGMAVQRSTKQSRAQRVFHERDGSATRFAEDFEGRAEGTQRNTAPGTGCRIGEE